MADQVLRKVQTSSRELNQVQDQLTGVVNPALRLVSQGARTTQFYQALPTPTLAMHGVQVLVQADTSSPCALYVCLPNSAGGLEWVGLALSS